MRSYLGGEWYRGGRGAAGAMHVRLRATTRGLHGERMVGTGT